MTIEEIRDRIEAESHPLEAGPVDSELVQRLSLELEALELEEVRQWANKVVPCSCT
jgi:hypothetical protein